jgi:hypothetical protein
MFGKTLMFGGMVARIGWPGGGADRFNRQIHERVSS